MADEVIWASEPIPDSDDVFMRAHQVHFRNDQLQPGVFRQQGDGMPVDWEKYSTPLQTRARAANPFQNAVIALNVGRIRDIPGLQVQHTPDSERRNRAHSDVKPSNSSKSTNRVAKHRRIGDASQYGTYGPSLVIRIADAQGNTSMKSRAPQNGEKGDTKTENVA